MMENFLKYLWSDEFWSSPASAFAPTVVIISWFVFCEIRERRALRAAQRVVASGWEPVEHATYQHKWLPWVKCYVMFYTVSLNDKFMPAVYVLRGKHSSEIPMHKFHSRWSLV
ncbi:hypothetical protein pEaSNUABM13_00046 [Erwinia phage pEa_SNUABM_13]|uniref:Uncharacterized protein n=1 Tax=Erwinia phage pEa_SNUABM_7 TaxID=2866695 RepID=A0AAE7WS41_9CAUD|nr:hypothetical protein MPK74_gp045 [Erwinia phage pEa_SNUABM_7]QYW03005.1 hypothetical protein pEaSNUABM13_00046 [Erwinia phage pEa_SNUABM_13]QYW04713.1 hypothetical protein pEaSNUABM7_00045 [Erwinia phage pEa_SNUABM_7]